MGGSRPPEKKNILAAKRACRRGRVFLNGVQARSDTDAWPSDRIALQEPVEPGPAVPGGQVRFELTVARDGDGEDAHEGQENALAWCMPMFQFFFLRENVEVKK